MSRLQRMLYTVRFPVSASVFLSTSRCLAWKSCVSLSIGAFAGTENLFPSYLGVIGRCLVCFFGV